MTQDMIISIAIAKAARANSERATSEEVKTEHNVILKVVRRMLNRCQYDAAYWLVRDLVAFADDDYKRELLDVQRNFDLVR